MRRNLLVFALPVLAACATPGEPVIRTIEVRVPVAVPCVEPGDIPPVRPYADERIQPPARVDQMMDAMAEGITERDEDIPVLRALLAGCTAQ